MHVTNKKELVTDEDHGPKRLEKLIYIFEFLNKKEYTS